MLPPFPISEPRIELWASLALRLSAPQRLSFKEGLFDWLDRQILMIDYPYQGMDYSGDPDLLLPEGAHWDLTSTHSILLWFFFFVIYAFFYCTMKNLTLICLICTDTGLVRPSSSSPLHRRGAVFLGGVGEVGGLKEMEQNLEGLTARIPRMTFDGVPYHLHRHTVGMSQRLRSLL